MPAAITSSSSGKRTTSFLHGTGCRPKEREEVLWGLEACDYCSGPEMDPDYPGEVGVWEFTTNYRGMDMCIKIRLLPSEDGFYAKCLSFHE